MSQFFMFMAILIAGFAANANVEECTSQLASEIKFNARRAEIQCKRAEKANISTSAFASCIVGISQETKLAGEIVAPFCFERPDQAYKNCVVSVFNSDSNDNALKSCLKKKLSTRGSVKSTTQKRS